MKTALIIYQSRTGITKRFGEELSHYLNNKGLDTQVIPIQEYDGSIVEKFDYILLGCWTAGLMIMLQTPDRHWIKFAAQLPDLKDKKIALFTTYKLATGSMFKKMSKHLAGKSASITLELRSRNGLMNESHKQLIDSFIA